MSIRDTRMSAMAIERRWEISATARKAIIGRLLKIIADKDAKPREVVAATRGLLAAEAQNQLDEHKLIDATLQRHHDQLDAIAVELGIDPSLVAIASGQANRGPGSDPEPAAP